MRRPHLEDLKVHGVVLSHLDTQSGDVLEASNDKSLIIVCHYLAGPIEAHCPRSVLESAIQDRVSLLWRSA